MYDTPLTKRFKKTPYKAVKNVYSAATGKSLRTQKKTMLLELDQLGDKAGITFKVVCYRALIFEEYICVIKKEVAQHATTKDTIRTWRDNAFALKEVLRELRDLTKVE